MDLLDDLMALILLRLPVKILLCFKCVSKSWLSLISDPQFAKSHFELAATPTHRLLCLPEKGFTSQARSLDLDASSLHGASVSAPLNLSFLPPFSFTEIKCSCRGFLLLCHSFEDLYLWNPSTNIHRLLPVSPTAASNMDVPVLRDTIFYGFGYDPSKDDYLVLLASYDPVPLLSMALVKTCFELYSSRANAWEKIEGTDLPYMASDGPRTGTLLNGIIHWFAHCPDALVILAFDLVERKFSEVRLPNNFNPNYTFCDLCVLGGCLSVHVTLGDTTEIWVMKKYNVQSSWTKSFTLSNNDLPSPKQDFSPIFATRSGDIVGLNGSMLVKCNAEGQLLEHRLFCDAPDGCEAVMYRESLLSFPVEDAQATE
ncbi:hypothetical protein RIF29_40193 [Crotalaria pallida]|uniref:F-box protein n=1 Tax=Crotalaria pallida TaxID=3830 RepID=A0AAN9E2R2_CROPI